jgi:Histidine kinase
MPGIPLAAYGTREAARAAAGRAWHGLVQVLTGPEPPPVWRWQSPRERQVAYAALGVATLALCVVNLVPGVATLGQLLLAVPVVAPLPLAARYPMLAWRIGWLALLLAPLIPATWRGGWPWGAAQILALLGAFCLAGIRQQRPALWWMWALSLIPWWLWLAADVPDLNGPGGATVVFTAVAVAVDSIGSRLRAQRALAAQTERTEVERAQRAVLEERARIARELHDVVAHHMSLIAVRAETAPYRLPDLSETARAEFGSLSEVAREALAEMRRLLGVLRHDQPAALAPQPQLADLPALIDAARRAGVPVELSAPPRAGPGAPRRWGVRLPDRAGIAVQRQPARPRSRRHRVGRPGGRRGPAPGGQRPERDRRLVRGRARPRSRAHRDA